MSDREGVGRSIVVNGDPWTVVDVAPAPELAEMVAVILEEAGFVVLTRSAHGLGDVVSHLGVYGLSTTYTLVPAAAADAALELIAATVTDYEGDDLDAVLAELAEAGPGGPSDDGDATDDEPEPPD